MSVETGIAAQNIPALKPREFEQIRRLAYDQFGLELRAGKEQLVSARLAKIIRASNFRSFQQYYDFLVRDSTGEALTAMIDALTTNHTGFFREPAHFDFLKSRILPDLKSRDYVSIWSAACSSGEEPYSIAFCLMQNLSTRQISRVRILATDISTKALSQAEKGVYPSERLTKPMQQELKPYLLYGEEGAKGHFRVRKEIRNLVDFRRLNLMHSLSHLGQFQIIFCRNVMIYFDKATQQDLVRRLSDCLEPGGHLLTGHAESLNRIEHDLQYVQPAVYQKRLQGRGGLERARISP
jgi:chemotaxis protein methyltransferase CheR